MARQLFKKGQSGNPSGRPGIPKDVIQIRKINGHDFERLLHKIVQMDDSSTRDILSDPTRPNLERMLAAAVISAIGPSKDSFKYFEAVTNRLVGKVPDRIETPNPYENMTPEEKLIKAREVVKLLESQVGDE